LSTGSVNFPTRVYENAPNLVQWLSSEMMTYGVKPEVEAFDLSMIFKSGQDGEDRSGAIAHAIRDGCQKRDASRS